MAHSERIYYFTEALKKFLEEENAHNQAAFDKLYEREKKNVERYNAALQRCRELLSMCKEQVDPSTQKAINLYMEILADLLNDAPTKYWQGADIKRMDQMEFYKEWVQKREGNK
jgi:hypothetical protein